MKTKKLMRTYQDLLKTFGVNKASKWLEIWWKGKMVEIDSKGKVRAVRRRK